MPTSGRASASSSKPMPFNIARAGARSTPSVSAALRRLPGSVGRAYGSLPLLPADMCLLPEQALDPGELPQLLPDPFDLARLLLPTLAQLGEARAPGLVVGEELLRERAAADLLEDL